MLETLFCTLVAVSCISGTPEVPFDAIASAESAPPVTEFERLNAARAARQGTHVVQHEPSMPHLLPRAGVTLRSVFEIDVNCHHRPPFRLRWDNATPAEVARYIERREAWKRRVASCGARMSGRRLPVARPETVIPGNATAIR